VARIAARGPCPSAALAKPRAVLTARNYLKIRFPVPVERLRIEPHLGFGYFSRYDRYDAMVASAFIAEHTIDRHNVWRHAQALMCLAEVI